MNEITIDGLINFAVSMIKEYNEIKNTLGLDFFFFPFCHLQITEIPKLTSGCTEFIESAEQILEKRKMNQTLLANHSTLLDLLEIPQLMDTYVFEKIMKITFL